MKMTFGFDTSALISLGHTGLVEEIVNACNIVVTESILDELYDIGNWGDLDAKSAKMWLKCLGDLDVRDSERRENAEDELFIICNQEGIPIVIDDIKAFKRFDGMIECLFSVHIVYFLYKSNKITRENALLSIEKMRVERDWKRNIIALTGRMLFE